MNKIDKKLVEEILKENNDNFLKKVNNNLYLREKEINILNKYNINYYSFLNISDLLYYLELELNNNYNEELENLSYELSERNYYENTNK